MWMRAEALPRSDPVFVNHTKAAEGHVLRIVVIGERECMVGVEPPMLGVASLLTPANPNHLSISLSRRFFLRLNRRNLQLDLEVIADRDSACFKQGVPRQAEVAPFALG